MLPPEDVLEKMATHRLLNIFKIVRGQVFTYNPDIDPEYESRIAELREYKEKVKTILDNREHVKRKT